MVTGFYFATLLISMGMLYVNLFKSKKADTRFVLMSATITLNCFGQYLISIAESLDVAILSHKIMSIGACFTAPIAIFIVVQFCGLKLPKVLSSLLYGLAFVTYGFILTIGYSDLYYKNVQLCYNSRYDYHYITKEYGLAHNLYTLLIAFCAVLLLIYVIIAIRKKNNISTRTVITITGLTIIVILCYSISRLTNSTIEWFTFGFLIAALVLTKMFTRITMYDMSLNISNYVDRMNEYGYIVFDKKLRYMNSNGFAKEVFPAIADWSIDSVIDKKDTTEFRKASKNLKDWIESPEDRMLRIDDRYVEVSLCDLCYGENNKKIGYIIEITDKTAEQRYLNTVKSYNVELEIEVAERTADINRIKDMMVLGMASMVESRDNSTGGHIKRTSDVVRIFSERLIEKSEEMKISKSFLDLVSKAAPMHDLGKIAVDDNILRKQGKFTDEEYSEMKKHSAEGAKIVHNILTDVENDDFVAIATNVAYFHHEKWNGMGYPNGLKNTEIPLEARIMALADVFDALVSKRCYKEAFSYDKAFSIIENDLGSHFDPELGKVFLECRIELEALYNSY